MTYFDHFSSFVWENSHFCVVQTQRKWQPFGCTERNDHKPQFLLQNRHKKNVSLLFEIWNNKYWTNNLGVNVPIPPYYVIRGEKMTPTTKNKHIQKMVMHEMVSWPYSIIILTDSIRILWRIRETLFKFSSLVFKWNPPFTKTSKPIVSTTYILPGR